MAPHCRLRSEFKRRQKLVQKEKEQAEKKVRAAAATRGRRRSSGVRESRAGRALARACRQLLHHHPTPIPAPPFRPRRPSRRPRRRRGRRPRRRRVMVGRAAPLRWRTTHQRMWIPASTMKPASRRCRRPRCVGVGAWGGGGRVWARGLSIECTRVRMRGWAGGCDRAVAFSRGRGSAGRQEHRRPPTLHHPPHPPCRRGVRTLTPTSFTSPCACQSTWQSTAGLTQGPS